MRVQFNRLLNRPDATEINIRWQVTIPSRVSLELQDSLLVDNPLIDQLDMKIEEAKASEYAAQKQGSPAFGIGIDYVFVDPHYFTVKDAGIVSRDHWHASDHLAYYAQIALKYQNHPWEKTEN